MTTEASAGFTAMVGRKVPTAPSLSVAPLMCCVVHAAFFNAAVISGMGGPGNILNSKCHGTSEPS